MVLIFAYNVFSDNYEVNIGEKVAIPCIASGVPKPDIVWTRIESSQSNETSSLNVQGGILSLENAKKNQSGNYMCTVFNGARRFVRYGNTDCGVFKGGIQNHPNLSDFFFIEEYKFKSTFSVIDIF